jgi:hypothetical protein
LAELHEEFATVVTEEIKAGVKEHVNVSLSSESNDALAGIVTRMPINVHI